MRLQQYLNEAKEQLKQWKEYVMANKMLKSAVSAMKKIDRKGYDAWIVGGSVRDVIIGKEPHDVDLCTTAPIDELAKIWKVYDIGKSKQFGIVTVKEGGYPMEIARLRGDGKYTDGRRPESVSFNVELEDDLARRDLTVNACAIDKDGNIIDHFQGQKDIQDKVLRTVGNPYKRYSEDYLRIMRTARFAAKLGFDIEKKTGRAMKKMSGKVTDLAPERIKDEIMKAAAQSGDKFAKYIMLLDKYGILKHVLPELVAMKAYKEDLSYHPETKGKGGSPYAHTIEALKASDTKDPLKNLCVLIHDVGKSVTFSDTTPGKTYTYYGHDKEGVKLVKTIADRLKMSNKERDALLFTVANHMKFIKLADMKPSKVFKIVSDDNWDALVAVARADEFSRGQKFMSKRDFEKSLETAIRIKEKWGDKEVHKRMQLVDGNHVMELLGIGPGPKVGEVIKKTSTWILDNNIKDQQEIDDYIRSNWA